MPKPEPSVVHGRVDQDDIDWANIPVEDMASVLSSKAQAVANAKQAKLDAKKQNLLLEKRQKATARAQAKREAEKVKQAKAAEIAKKRAARERAMREKEAKAAVPKPKAKKHPFERLKAGEMVEWAGNDKHGDAHPSAISAQKRTNMLKALMQPKTEVMVKVMEDIARGFEVDPLTGAIKDLNVHPSVRLEAATRYLDRVYGKPKEHLQIDDGEADGVDGDEVTQLLNNILKSVGAPLLDKQDLADTQAEASDDEAG